MTSSEKLLDAARAVRNHAHAPYSGFLVGAAILTADGAIHAGCNVENIAYPEGTCAEAGAIASMVASAGRARIVEALVIADSPEPVTPCGGCRQKLAEFADGSMVLHLADLTGIRVTTTLGEIFPGAFSTEHFQQTRNANG